MGLETGYRWRDAPQWQGYFGIGRRDRNAKQIASLQMVFQNPFDTLNPSHSIGGQISRVLRKFGG
jgi:peptide/nickel transport system ATP-binding protein